MSNLPVIIVELDGNNIPVLQVDGNRIPLPFSNKFETIAEAGEPLRLKFEILASHITIDDTRK